MKVVKAGLVLGIFSSVSFGDTRAQFDPAVVRVTLGAPQTVDLVLSVGQITQSVEVTGVTGVESDLTDRRQVINSQQIVDLPLNGLNDSDLALLTTGVRQSVLAFNGPREGSFNVNCQRSTFNNFMMGRGYWMIEMDIQEARDGHIFVHRDDSAKSHGDIVSINDFHYIGRDDTKAAKDDIERLAKLGLVHFQIDSIYDQWLR